MNLRRIVGALLAPRQARGLESLDFARDLERQSKRPVETAALKATDARSPGLAIRDPFAVIPLQPENVDVRKDGDGLIHLRLTPVLKPSYRKLAALLRYDTTRKIELDAHGSLYYGLVDGQRSLGEIVDALVSGLGKTRKEVEPMVIRFTKTLMTKNLVALKVPGQNATEGPR